MGDREPPEAPRSLDELIERLGAGQVDIEAGRRFRVWFELEWSDERDAETAA